MNTDVDRIMAVMYAAFDPAYGEAWTRRQVSDALVVRGTHYMLANNRGEAPAPGEDTAGFAMSRGAVDEEELLLIAVAPEWRGRGVGKRLLQRFLESAQERGAARIFLEMRDGNPAEFLYRAQGFESVGRRPGYYRGAHEGPIDAITFARINP